MPEIIALSCPVCGAPLAPGTEKCAHCGSYIVIKTDLPKLERHTLNQAVIQEHIADFRKRIRSNQYDEEAHYGLGVAYYSLGLTNDAIEELTSAARLMPENPNIQSQLAVALYDAWKTGDTTAETKLNQRIASTLLLDPDNLEASVLKIEILIGKGQLREAANSLQTLYRHNSPQARDKLVSILQNMGRESLSSRRWDDAAWCWQTLGPVDGNAASDLALEFMHLNAQRAPKQFRKYRGTSTQKFPPTPQAQASPAPQTGTAKRVMLLVLNIIAAVFVGLVLMTIIMSAGLDESADAGAGRSFTALFVLLGVIVGWPVWFWKRSNPNRERTQSSALPTTPRFNAKSRMVPLVDNAEVIEAAEKTLKAVKFHEGFQSASSTTVSR